MDPLHSLGLHDVPGAGTSLSPRACSSSRNSVGVPGSWLLAFTSRLTLYSAGEKHLYRPATQVWSTLFNPYHWYLNSSPSTATISGWGFDRSKRSRHVHVCANTTHTLEGNDLQGLFWVRSLYKSVPILGRKPRWHFSDDSFPTPLLAVSLFSFTLPQKVWFFFNSHTWKGKKRQILLTWMLQALSFSAVLAFQNW